MNINKIGQSNVGDKAMMDRLMLCDGYGDDEENVSPSYKDIKVWNDALSSAIEAILDIKGEFDGDTILRAREIIKGLKK